jgi:hypothetical protein
VFLTWTVAVTRPFGDMVVESRCRFETVNVV